MLKNFSARLIRFFADDIIAVFDDPNNAVDAAFEIHRRMKLLRHSSQASKDPTQCSIGIGHGNVFAIGPNLSQGDEMNRASKLGEHKKGGPTQHLGRNDSADSFDLFLQVPLGAFSKRKSSVLS